MELRLRATRCHLP